MIKHIITNDHKKIIFLNSFAAEMSSSVTQTELICDERASYMKNNYFENYQLQWKILDDMATGHREFEKSWLYVVNKAHYFCWRMLPELQPEEIGASNGFWRKDNKKNIAYNKMFESSCKDHQYECKIASFELQHLY